MTWDPSDVSPFAVLEIRPTLDQAAIKRAYFAMLTKHPPHQDQEGFKRIRAAYEALGTPGDAASFVLRHTPDALAELAPYRERHDAALARALEEGASRAEESARGTRFTEGLLRLDLESALSLFGSK